MKVLMSDISRGILGERASSRVKILVDKLSASFENYLDSHAHQQFNFQCDIPPDLSAQTHTKSWHLD